MTGSTVLSRWSRMLDRLVTRLTLGVAWVVLPLLILLTVVNVVGRQFHAVGSDMLSDLGSDLFFVLVMLSFGHAYLRDGHVRVDILRGRLPPRSIAWLELFGCVVIVIPLSGFLVGYGTDAAWRALAQGERAGAFGDLPLQWLVKASVPLGFLALLLAAVCVTIRNALVLLGMEEVDAP